MKLCIIHINAEKGSEPYTKLIDGIFKKVRNPDTEVVHRFARLKRASDTIFSYPYFINSLDVVHRFAEASQEGFDGAMVACCGDPGVIQARSISAIPIVGPFAATMHLACGYGQKFGVVTVIDRSWLEACDTIVAANGLTSRCAGIRAIDISSQEAFTRGFVEPKFVADEIERQARILVDQGANSIVIGSAGMSCIAAVAGLNQVSGLGVPIFDSLSVGLKTLEMRVQLSQRIGLPVTSRVGLTELFKPEDAARVRSLFQA